MKAVKFFLSALALATVSLLASPTINAQEDGNKDENGKVVRGPYLTNLLLDNWFAGGSLGVNTGYDNGTWRAGFGLDVNLGKWVTPSIGARAGFNGLTGSQGKFGYLHADVLLNISNAIGGYKETSFWDFVPYVHCGLLVDNGKEFAAGAGLLNLIRLTDRLDLTLDFRGNIAKQRPAGKHGYISSTVGVSVNIGKTNFIRASNWRNPKDVAALDAAAAAEDALKVANAALESDKQGLQNELVAAKEEIAQKDAAAQKAAAAEEALKAANAALVADNQALQEQLVIALEESRLLDVEPESFYFEIGKSVLSKKELEHLDFYIMNVLPYVKGKSLTVITGSADKNTGSAKRNAVLCKQRYEYVKKILVEKYGFNADDFEFRSNVTNEGNAEFNRAVVISFE